MENDFLATDKNFSTAKKSFLSFTQVNMKFLAWYKTVQDKNDFVLNKNNFVWTEGQGISPILWSYSAKYKAQDYKRLQRYVKHHERLAKKDCKRF